MVTTLLTCGHTLLDHENQVTALRCQSGLLANAASLYAISVSYLGCRSSGTSIRHRCIANLKHLFASLSVESVALLVSPASWLTVAWRCGLLCVAGHWSAPTKPLSIVRCFSLTGWSPLGLSSKDMGFCLAR